METTTYVISWSNGRTERHDTYDPSRDAVLAEYPDAEIGHDGDGKRAVAKIHMEVQP